MRLKYRQTRLVRTRDAEWEAAERGTCNRDPRGRRRIARDGTGCDAFP